MPDEPKRRADATPLITAVEIENFKGIGRRVRIDLRPITLLFGRNSAGKSTVLHALCYAHEVLSHGNVDVGKTDLGGDQVDLGGFRQLVHAHDLDRDVRLRFELNLSNWEIPPPLLERMKLNDWVQPDFGDEFAHWIDSQASGKSVRSGWVELAVTWSKWLAEPVLAVYEVGVNEALLGRVVRTGSLEAPVNLEFNWAHPLFDPFRSAYTAAEKTVVGHVSETSDPRHNAWQLPSAMVYGPTPLPAWDRLLPLNREDLDNNEEVAAAEETNLYSFPKFQSLVSGFVVGIGRTLRDELAALRHIGPVRKLRPPTHVEPGSRIRGSWSDGSAAWNLVLYGNPNPTDRDLLKDVNDWLARDDRLDIGYRLRRQETVELPANATPVSGIRYREWLSAKYPKGDGTVDLDGWTRELAEMIVGLHGGDPDDVAARIKDARGRQRQSAETNTGDQTHSAAERVVEAAREHHQSLVDLVSTIDRLDKGRPAAAVKKLVRAIADAPLRTTLQLVTVGAELPVRTADIGVGISQLLPVVVAALDPQRPAITAIEQPELHLHPRLQVELGDLFAQPANDGRGFLLENHSEHLMLRLLRRIEETHSGDLPEGKPPLRPDQVAVVFLEQVDGEVRATPLRIDETGEFIDRWPQGFFDERDDELF